MIFGVRCRSEKFTGFHILIILLFSVSQSHEPWWIMPVTSPFRLKFLKFFQIRYLESQNVFKETGCLNLWLHEPYRDSLFKKGLVGVLQRFKFGKWDGTTITRRSRRLWRLQDTWSGVNPVRICVATPAAVGWASRVSDQNRVYNPITRWTLLRIIFVDGGLTVN